MSLDLSITLYTKSEFKWIIEVNVRAKNIKQKQTQDKIFRTLGQAELLGMTPKAQNIVKENDQFYFIKTNFFAVQKLL